LTFGGLVTTTSIVPGSVGVVGVVVGVVGVVVVDVLSAAVAGPEIAAATAIAAADIVAAFAERPTINSYTANSAGK